MKPLAVSHWGTYVKINLIIININIVGFPSRHRENVNRLWIVSAYESSVLKENMFFANNFFL